MDWEKDIKKACGATSPDAPIRAQHREDLAQQVITAIEAFNECEPIADRFKVNRQIPRDYTGYFQHKDRVCSMIIRLKGSYLKSVVLISAYGLNSSDRVPDCWGEVFEQIHANTFHNAFQTAFPIDYGFRNTQNEHQRVQEIEKRLMTAIENAIGKKLIEIKKFLLVTKDELEKQHKGLIEAHIIRNEIGDKKRLAKKMLHYVDVEESDKITGEQLHKVVTFIKEQKALQPDHLLDIVREVRQNRITLEEVIYFIELCIGIESLKTPRRLIEFVSRNPSDVNLLKPNIADGVLDEIRTKNLIES